MTKRLAIPSVFFLTGQIELACNTRETSVYRLWRSSLAVPIFLSAGTAVAQGYVGDAAIEGKDAIGPSGIYGLSWRLVSDILAQGGRMTAKV